MFSLGGMEMARFVFAVAVLLFAANVLGYLAERLTVPRIIGEVSGGLILGPTLFGHFFSGGFHWLFLGFASEGPLFGFLSELGLILLMFNSGLKFQHRFEKGDGKIGLTIIVGSTVIPFLVGWLATYLFNPHPFLGPDQNALALKIVVAISIAVTSIPVISKIFSDLGIIHSRFAKIIIGIAGVHDILLWVGLAIASGIVSSHHGVSAIALLESLGVTLGFLAVSVFVVPWILRRITSRRANFVFRASFLGYFLLLTLALSDIAGYLNLDMMYGALLAGIATKLTLPEKLMKRVENSVREISFSFFIPLYFAIIGLQLNLATQFSVGFFVLYLVFATVVQATVVYFSCRLVNTDARTSFNLAAAMNARGGPGIVLSQVAFALGIINQNFFAILVMLALFTSWMSGSWIRHVLKSGRRLMPGDENLVVHRSQEEAPLDWQPEAL
ncbi:cation:proton antiporter [Alicyclobacillaceae bacterium I2511]|nr:cation:proton antiporter [Alicyclobacillaceae bacterium I2511]